MTGHVQGKFVWLVLSSIFAIVLFPSASWATASRYTVTDLSPYWGPYTEAIGTNLNNHGQVLGYVYSVYPLPFLYTPGEGVRSITSEVGSSPPIDINDEGQLLIGAIHGGDPFVYPGGDGYPDYVVGGMVTELPRILSPIANDINNLGQVAGAVALVDQPIMFTQHAFHAHVYTPSVGTEFLDPPGDEARSFDTSSYARLINDRGEVVGISIDEAKNRSAFLRRTDGTFLEFGNLGYERIEPEGLNNNGQVILNGGNTYSSWTTCTPLDSIGGYNAFLYDPDAGLIDLNEVLGGDCVYATGINDLGDIIGVVDSKPFVYSATDGFVDLTTLLALEFYQPAGQPIAINNRGQILLNEGSPLLVTPMLSRVPEPRTYLLFAAGVGLFAFKRQRFLLRKKAGRSVVIRLSHRSRTLAP